MSQLQAVFDQAAKNNIWQNAESVSGPGSTIIYTANVRSQISVFFHNFKLSSMLDAPCGDFNWMRNVEFPEDFRYIGGDIVQEIVDKNRDLYATDNKQFIHLDITKDPLPDADIFFCRDCLFHLPFQGIYDVLVNFCRSDFKFLVMTNHLNTGDLLNLDVPAGGFRPLDFYAEPFCFPENILFAIADYVHPFPRREICVWSKEQVADVITDMQARIDGYSPASGTAPVRTPWIEDDNVEAASGRVLKHVLNATGGVVFAGPMAGMKMSIGSAWGPLDLPSRLLGSYESELHDVLNDGVAIHYDKVADIGCADGFYAVGLARLYADAEIYAYDTNNAAQSLTRQNAELNAVSDRVQTFGTCSHETLVGLGKISKRLLIVCDCEGHEVELLTPDVIKKLGNADFIIECHDFIVPRCTATLKERFGRSHDIVDIEAGARNPNQYPMLRGIGETDRWLAMCEYRHGTMNWIIARSRSVGRDPISRDH